MIYFAHILISCFKHVAAFIMNVSVRLKEMELKLLVTVKFTPKVFCGVNRMQN